MVSLTACLGASGNGEKTTETREVADFTRVENRSTLEVEVHQAEQPSFALTLDSNLHRSVTARVEGNALVIDTSEPIDFSGEGRVVVTLPRLLGAEQDGSGALRVEGLTQVEDVELVLDGSGSLRYCGPARTVSARVDGSGSMTLCTPAEQTVESVHLSVEGSGSLSYEGAAGLVDAFNGDSGQVTLRGLAQRLKARALGSGGIEARELSARDAMLEAHGSGPVSATVNGGGVSVVITGSGGVELWGDASLRDVRDEGSGSLVRH
jgi:hypothetical protein